MENFATLRLTAEKLAPRHLDDLVALHLDPDVSLYLGGVRSAEVTKAYLDTNLAHWSEHGFGLWVLRTQDGAFVGRAGIRYTLLEGAPELEIAYALARNQWGLGFATEIAAALVDLWLARPTAPSLAGIVSIGNAASAGVLRKVGFSLERAAVFHGEDVSVFRRVRPG